MGHGPQKPDSGKSSNFYIMPRMVQDSQAWRHASLRARVVLSVIMAKHNGFNNGRIALTVRQIGEAIGDQNHGSNGKAIAELIGLGFLECTADANHQQSKAREFRITFISTGEGKRQQPATNEYTDWRPKSLQRKKFGAARTATTNTVFDAATATPVKKPVAATAARKIENGGNASFANDARVAVTASLLVNQSAGRLVEMQSPGSVSSTPRAAEPITVDLDELRTWAQAVIRQLGNARPLARDSGVPEPTLSRFRNGKALPEHYRVPLQTACGRVLPFVAWKAQAA